MVRQRESTHNKLDHPKAELTNNNLPCESPCVEREFYSTP
jgi:hypothetical protein